MKNEIKKYLIEIPFFYFIRRSCEIISLVGWVLKGKPIPPPHLVKQRTLRKYANKFTVDTLVETGTYLGDMIFAMRRLFKTIYSIEMDEHLYKKAKSRFLKYSNISIFHGDTSDILPQILKTLYKPILFWLDAHYSGGITTKGSLEYPIIKELQYIFGHSIRNHVILIDDARMFDGCDGRPQIKHIMELAYKNYPNCIFEVENDIISICPK
ncbi:hypothetical protein M0R36_07735 [bacterium]|jgi:hypothetical protein|nr:hypothetical protein [bacterium]